MNMLLRQCIAAAGFSLCLTACISTVDERVLVGSARLGAGTEDSELRESLVALEAGTGLFLGRALGGLQPGDDPDGNVSLSANVGGQRAEWVFPSRELVSATVTWRHIATGYGDLPLVYVAADTSDASPETRPLFVHCYGNGSNLYNNATVAALVALPHGDILQFEYPGYDHTATADATDLRRSRNFEIMIDALAADLNAQDVARPLVFWGHSLGGMVCADLAGRVAEADGLILEATAADAQAMVRAQTPAIARVFLRPVLTAELARYELVESLVDFEAPILVLGGGKDRILPVSLSREVRDRLAEAGHDVWYREFPGANHLSISTEMDFPETVSGFVVSLGLARP